MRYGYVGKGSNSLLDLKESKSNKKNLMNTSLLSQSPCPKCQSEFPYQDGSIWICPECAHEWLNADSKDMATITSSESEDLKIIDAHGNILQDGDAITVIKDLKVKGSSLVVKVGSKAKNIRIVESSDGHNISCKIEGVGAMNLKSEFVKKS